MRETKKSFFICPTCEHEYSTAREAINCEKMPERGDKGAKFGDYVIITTGEGAGSKAIVKRRWVYDKYWGHCAWERYWHTIGLDCEIIEGKHKGFHRQLTYDDYEKVEANNG